MNVYSGQSLLSIKLDTEMELLPGDDLSIMYQKPMPASVKGEWEATQVGTTSVIKYELAPGDIDKVGEWLFQAKVTRSGRIAKGEIVKITFERPIN